MTGHIAGSGYREENATDQFVKELLDESERQKNSTVIEHVRRRKKNETSPE